MNAFQRLKLLIQLNDALGKLQEGWKKYEMNPLSLSQVLKSKTFWTGLIGAAVEIYGHISGQLPKNVTDFVAAATPLLMIIWKTFFTNQVPTPKQ